jgi:hypothetical protein
LLSFGRVKLAFTEHWDSKSDTKGSSKSNPSQPHDVAFVYG